MRKRVVAAMSLYGIAAATMLGLLSNWFRYGLSLEATLVTISIAIGGTIVLVIGALALRTPRPSIIVTLCVAILASGVVTPAIHRSAFGSWLPAFELNHVETSGDATVIAHGQVVRYRLELQNPFSGSHKEYLIVNSRGRDLIVPVPIFDAVPGGYLSATQPSDWVILHPTEKDDVFDVKIGTFLAEKRLRVNLKTNEATVLKNSE